MGFNLRSDKMYRIKHGLVGFEPSDILDEREKRSKRRDKDESSGEKQDACPLTKKKRNKKAGLTGNTDQQSNVAAKSAKEIERYEDAELTLKKNRKRKRKAEDDVDPLYLREVIPFGERVDEPPKLTAVPKKAKKGNLSKAGAKDLLLRQRLEAPVSLDLRNNNRRYENDGTIKCDDPEKQRLLEEERQRVIEAYRIKKRLLREKAKSD